MKQEFGYTNYLDTMESVNQEQLADATEQPSDARHLAVGEACAIVPGAQSVSDLPAVKERISEYGECFAERLRDSVETAKEYADKVAGEIRDFCGGVYDDARDFLGLRAKESPTTQRLSEGITEGREFGLDECSEAALEIFNPGVISEWGNLTQGQRKDIACMYADRVARAFGLATYGGVYIEALDPGVLGYNNGDGTIHLSDTLVSGDATPFETMNTITHELRHQYQGECVRGYHEVSDEVRNEWTMATGIYNYDQPSCYDPWGYTYNPLEIDARYAGETVVRNVSSQLLNDAAASI